MSTTSLLNAPLDSAIIIGHTTPTTARLWVRGSKAGSYVLMVTADDKPTQNAPLNFPIELTPATDLTGVIDVSGLEAHQTYRCQLVHKESDEHEHETRFRTLSDSPTKFAFGLFSCHMPYSEDDPEGRPIKGVWGDLPRRLEQWDADFCIASGDQIYSDGHHNVNLWERLKARKNTNPAPDQDEMLAWYREVYRLFWGFADIQNTYGRYPTYMMWDDHEIVDGWGSMTDENIARRLSRWPFFFGGSRRNFRLAKTMISAGKQAYQEYQHCHNPDTPKDQWDYTLTSCGSDFYVLDCRGHRTMEGNVEKRVLGESQFQRYRDWLEKLAPYSEKPTPIFVVSSIPLVHVQAGVSSFAEHILLRPVRYDLRDHWTHNSHIEELLELIDLSFKAAQRTGRPLVFLSGDVHVAAVFHLSSTEYPEVRAFQVTSSGITSKPSPLIQRMVVVEKGYLGTSKFRFSRLGLVLEHNFGIVEWDAKTNPEQPSLLVRIYSALEDAEPSAKTRENVIDLLDSETW